MHADHLEALFLALAAILFGAKVLGEPLRALLKGTKGTPQAYSSVAEIATDI